MILNQLTTAHFFAREFDDAVAWSSRAADEYPNFTPARRFLAASLAHLGRTDEARKAVADLLRIQPNSSLTLSRLNSYRYPWMIDLHVDGLRLAGLPE
jgi:adenylate cyclase